MNLKFSWLTPNNVQFNFTTTDEDDSRTATSTLHIGKATHNDGGVYQCIVRNDGQQNNNNSVSSTIVIEGS